MNEPSIQKELMEMKGMLEIAIQQKSSHDSDMKKVITELRQEFNDFKLKIDPMLRAFNESENKKMVWGKVGVTIENRAKWVIYILGAVGAIWGMLKFGIRILKL